MVALRLWAKQTNINKTKARTKSIIITSLLYSYQLPFLSSLSHFHPYKADQYVSVFSRTTWYKFSWLSKTKTISGTFQCTEISEGIIPGFMIIMIISNHNFVCLATACGFVLVGLKMMMIIIIINFLSEVGRRLIFYQEIHAIPRFCSSASQCLYSASTALWSRTPFVSLTKTRTSSHQWYRF